MPEMVTVICRYCGASREVPRYYANRYSTCGAPECRKRQIADRAEAARATNLGRTQDAEERAMRSAAAKGRSQSPEHVTKRTASRRTKGAWFKDPDIGERICVGRKTGKPPDITGPVNPMWKGGVWRSSHQPSRNEREYREWQAKVLDRDNHQCRVCGSRRFVIAHHIKDFREHVHLRVDPANGIALCRSCHTKVHIGTLSLEGYYTLPL